MKATALKLSLVLKKAVVHVIPYFGLGFSVYTFFCVLSLWVNLEGQFQNN